DADWHSFLRVFCLLCGSTHGVKTDEGEKDHTRPAHNTTDAICTKIVAGKEVKKAQFAGFDQFFPFIGRNKGFMVGRIDKTPSKWNKDQHYRHFNHYEDVIDQRRFLRAADKQQR